MDKEDLTAVNEITVTDIPRNALFSACEFVKYVTEEKFKDPETGSKTYLFKPTFLNLLYSSSDSDQFMSLVDVLKLQNKFEEEKSPILQSVYAQLGSPINYNSYKVQFRDSYIFFKYKEDFF
jgi:hypothetical protein